MFKQITCIIILYISILAPTYVFADTTLGPERIEKDTIFTKAKSPYSIQYDIAVKEGVKLTVESGAAIVFNGGSLFLKKATLIGSNFTIEVTENSNPSFLISGDNCNINLSHINTVYMPRSFISVWNNSSVTLNSVNISFSGVLNKTGVQVFNNSTLIVDDSTFHRFTKALDIFNTSYATVTDSLFDSNHHAVYTFDSSIYLRRNDFIQNKIATEFFTDQNTDSIIDAQNNWWGTASRPSVYMSSSDIGQDDINVILGNVIYAPWSLSPNKKPQQGDVSNVLFLPGLMGSRLYKRDAFENQLWEPNRNKDVKKLYLNSEGKSIEPNIYTRDVLAKTNIAGGVSAIEQTPYKDFFVYMNELVRNSIIQSWKPAPYDWRFAPDIILEQGISLGNVQGQIFTNSLVAEVLLLAKTSKTKKVTIVTHSNGGLVGKQLMIELKKQNLETLVDKIIFVAMPEYGTPQAITSLLYGHEQSIAGGLIMSAGVAQKLGINMSTAYTLLPSQKYFNFDQSVSVGKEFIQNKSLLNIKLTELGNINNNLLHKADQLHASLDAWIPPQTASVYQVVGTGLLTVSGFMEKTNKKPIPTYTTSGDGVVQDMYDKSALEYHRTGQTFTVDLHNSKNIHMDIMNNTGVMTYIDTLLRKTSSVKNIVYPTYVNAYTLFSISSSFATTSLSHKNMQAQTYISKDTLSYLPLQQFQTTRTTNSLSRYDVFGNSVQYITQENVQKFEISEQVGDVVDIHVFNNTGDMTREIVYTDVKLFADSGLSLKNIEVGNSSQTNIEITLPAVNQKIEISPITEVLYGTNNQIIHQTYIATSTEDILTKIARIKKLIQLSNITSYVKTRYVSRLDILAKNISLKKATSTDILLLHQKAQQSVKSINSFSNSSALKGRYSKLKQDYMYLSYILK